MTASGRVRFALTFSAVECWAASAWLINVGRLGTAVALIWVSFLFVAARLAL